MLDRAAHPKSVRSLAVLSLAVLTLAVLTYTRADPDLWGHVRFGRDMVAANAVRLADRYAFASDRPWVNHEWLAEIVMYGAYRAAGGTGLVALKVLLVAAMLAAVVVGTARRRQTRLTRYALFGLALVATVPQAVHVRPQLFSLALFAWLLIVLLRARESGSAPLTAIPIVALWANLHGGWIVGAAVLAMWAGIGAIVDARGRSIVTLLVAGAAILASLCNPYGVGLWAFLRSTVGFGRADITDWQPVLQMGGMYVVLWVATALVLAAAFAAAVRRGAVDLQAFAIPLALAVGSFRVNRLQAFFAIATVMLAGRAFESGDDETDAEAPSRSEAGVRVAVAMAIVMSICVVGAGAAANNAACIRVDPAASPEPGVEEFVRAEKLRGRMLTWFAWGEYAIWQWSDQGIRVSMDGRRETVYSDQVLQDHLRFYFDPNAREEVLARLRPDYIWLPANLDAVAWLSARGWRTLFLGERSVLLTRADRISERRIDTLAIPARRCFPGP